MLGKSWKDHEKSHLKYKNINKNEGFCWDIVGSIIGKCVQRESFSCRVVSPLRSSEYVCFADVYGLPCFWKYAMNIVIHKKIEHPTKIVMFCFLVVSFFSGLLMLLSPGHDFLFFLIIGICHRRMHQVIHDLCLFYVAVS